MKYLLGLDDTDSKFGHCTTHLGYLIVSELHRMGCDISTYPRLVRLNPNIPFKTRGNAAVCIEFQAESQAMAERAFETAESLFEKEADTKNGANSGLVVVSTDSETSYFRELYQKAVRGVVNHRRVARDMSRMGIRVKLLGNGMGVVGAAAALGFSPEEEDHTYELISYRLPENCGSPRRVEPESVKEMEASTFPHTFNNYDHESERVLVAPKGPDPVLAGIRGDSPRAVLEALRMVETEVPLGHMIYATNQCTDAHLGGELSLPLKAFSAGWLEGSILSTKTIRGSHIELGLETGDGVLRCMVYEPSGDLRMMARRLKAGDSVRIFGGVRRASSKNPSVLNVERIEVVKAAKLDVGAYLPSPRAQRHLTKQLARYGKERVGVHGLIDGWLKPPAELARVTARRKPRKA